MRLVAISNKLWFWFEHSIAKQRGRRILGFEQTMDLKLVKKQRSGGRKKDGYTQPMHFDVLTKQNKLRQRNYGVWTN